MPIAYILVPPGATAKTLATEFARYLGIPITARMAQTQITESVRHTYNQTGDRRNPPHQSRTAKVHETLGDHRTAAEQCALAATARPANTYACIVALDLIAGAEMHLKRGSIEQACATWHRAIDHMGGVHSVRTRKAVSRMRSDLARFRARGLQCVAELDERGHDFLAGA